MPALNSGHTVGYVRYPTLIRSIQLNCRWSLLGDDTGLAFTCPDGLFIRPEPFIPG